MTASSQATIREWLRRAEAELSAAEVDTARLDSLVLLSDELERDKAWLLAHLDFVLQGSEMKILNTKITQRARHVPLAYIRGKAEFYGREFTVNEHVLVPRAESEAMIDLLLNSGSGKQEMGNEKWEMKNGHGRGRGCAIVDVGTGSGCLAITAKLELPKADVAAIDIDPNCLKIARQNARALDANITFLRGNLLESADIPNSKFQILICNLPYVPEAYPINQAARCEPKLALFSGEDGLGHYRDLFAQVAARSVRPTLVLTESLPKQHVALAQLAETAGLRLTDTKGYVQAFTHLA